MRAARIGSRLPVGLGFLAVSGALLFRAAEYYSAPWAWLGLISGIFLALAVPWMVSAVRPWNVWNLHAVAFLVALTAPAGIMVVAAMLASAHHAGDFTAHAVARTGTVTAVQANAPAGDASSNPWDSHAILALARPVAGQHTVVLRPPYDLGYAAGDRVAVLVDPRHLGDVELPGHQGWTTKGLVVGATGSAAALGLALFAVIVFLAEGPVDDAGRKPDFLDSVWQSWARWRSEPQDLIPWTGAVRAVAWLLFAAITTLSVYAMADWSQWWLYLLPGIPVAIGSAAAAAGRSFPRFGDAAWPLASLAVAAAAPVLLITGVLPPAAGVPLMAAAWLTGVIAMSATGRRELTRAAT